MGKMWRERKAEKKEGGGESWRRVKEVIKEGRGEARTKERDGGELEMSDEGERRIEKEMVGREREG